MYNIDVYYLISFLPQICMLQHLRPLMVEKYPQLAEASSPLFPVAKKKLGVGAANPGTLIRNICKKTLGLQISANRLRMLMETVSNALYQNGHCTKEQRCSVSNVSGHSGQVVNCQLYYNYYSYNL
jgi:hypothetical protein